MGCYKLTLCVGLLIFDTQMIIQKNSTFHKGEYVVFKLRKNPVFELPPGELLCICLNWFLVRIISFLAAQPSVVVIKDILQRDVDNLTMQKT